MKISIPIQNATLTIIAALALIIFGVTAYHSNGYYHADEHYQLIQFAGLKQGISSSDDLAWEYKAQIRAATQVGICYVVFETCEALNISSSYNKAFILRLLSAILAIFSISFFIRSTQPYISERIHRTAYYLLSFFLWFIPFISVRFSSETWSGLVFLMALAVFHKKHIHSRTPLIIGVLLGVSFLFRFQIGLAIMGFILWLLFIQKYPLINTIKILSAITLIIGIGLIIDSWFYGEMVFTPWNYFYVNIVADAASGFGTSPWYYYLEKLLSFPGYLIGIPIVLAFIVQLISDPKNFLLWCTLPFIIGHSIIPHKEERFLFPIVFLFPLILMNSYTWIRNHLPNNHSFKIMNYLFIATFIVVNGIGICVMGQKSAGIGRMEVSKYIHDQYGDETIHLVFCSWANPYNPWHGVPDKFYLEKSITDHRIHNLCGLHDSLFNEDAVNLLVLRKWDKENTECITVLQDSAFHFETQSIPKWIERINATYQGFSNQDILELYRYSKLD